MVETLHAEATANVGVGDAHVVRRQRELLCQFTLLAPNTLTVDGQMQLGAVPFREAAPRLHRGDDDAVVNQVQFNSMCRSLERRVGGVFVPEGPVQHQIVRRFGMDRLTADSGFHMHRQVVILQLDQVQRINALFACFRNDDRDCLAHKTNPVDSQNRTVGRRTRFAITARASAEGHGVGHDAVHVRRR